MFPGFRADQHHDPRQEVSARTLLNRRTRPWHAASRDLEANTANHTSTSPDAI